MNDVDEFARLRPAVEPLAEATRARLRAELFPSEVPTLVLPQRAAAEATARPVSEPPPAPFRFGRRRLAVLVAAAATVMLAGTLALASHPFGGPGNRIQAGDEGPAGTVPSVGSSTMGVAVPEPGAMVSLAPEPVPLLTITDVPGWSLSYASVRSEPVAPLILARPGQGLEGPLVQVSQPGDGPTAYGDDPIDTVVNGGRGILSVNGEMMYLSWSGPGGGTLLAVARGLSQLELTTLAQMIDIDDTGRPALTRPVDGFAPIDDASAAALAFVGSYEFVNTDGRQLLVTVYPGGSFMNAWRIGTDQRRPVSFAGESVPLLDYGHDSGRYRVNVTRGFWAWELDGSPFTDPEEFLSLLDHLVSVDQETWNDSLPAGIVGPPQRPTVVAELTAGLPVPEGFDEARLAGRPTTDRREAVAEEVVRAVACAWLQTLVGTDGSGGAATQTAADALGAVSRSGVLQEAGVYGTGLPEYLGQLSTELSSAAPSEASSADTARRARQELACAERGD